MQTLHGTTERSGTLLVTGRALDGSAPAPMSPGDRVGAGTTDRTRGTVRTGGNDRVTGLPRRGRGQVGKAPESRHVDAVPCTEPDHPHLRFDPHRRHFVR